MKYLAALLLLTLSATAFAAKIVCTTYPVWLLTRCVAHNAKVSVNLMTPPHGGCAHNYTPLAGDLIKVKHPETILIANGSQVDEHLIAAAKRANPQLALIKAEVASRDAHTFASPDTAKLMVVKIATELCILDPANAPYYQKNLQMILPRFDELIQRTQALNLNGKVIVLHHKLFVNLANLCHAKTLLLKHEQASAVPPRDLMNIIRSARQHNTIAIWAENHHHDPAVKLLARETSLKIVELDMLNGGSMDVPFDHYINVMQCNLDKLEKFMR